jgi:hypothetical protein
MLMIDKVREVVLEFASHVAAIQDRARAWSYSCSAAPGVYIFLNADAGHSISR